MNVDEKEIVQDANDPGPEFDEIEDEDVVKLTTVKPQNDEVPEVTVEPEVNTTAETDSTDLELDTSDLPDTSDPADIIDTTGSRAEVQADFILGRKCLRRKRFGCRRRRPCNRCGRRRCGCSNSLPGNIGQTVVPSLPGNIGQTVVPSLPGNIGQIIVPSLPGNVGQNVVIVNDPGNIGQDVTAVPV